ncbi:SRPBCC family protein [Pseudoneobacillus sp. C159]
MKFEFSINIDAPREFVWRIAQDPELRPKWDIRIAKYVVHGEQKEGADVTITFKLGFLKPIGRAKFLKFQTPEQSILKISQVLPQLLPTGGGTWILEETSTGTKLTTRFLLDTEGIRSPDWLTKFIVARDTKESFQNLKKLVEELYVVK